MTTKIIKELAYYDFEWYADGELVDGDELPKKVMINNKKFKVKWVIKEYWDNVESLIFYYDGIVKDPFSGAEVLLLSLIDKCVPIFGIFKGETKKMDIKTVCIVFSNYSFNI